MDALKSHRIADVFPGMTSEDYIRLEHDIRMNGQREAIWLFEDQILDGRHRYKACHALAIEPKVKVFQGNEEEAMTLSLSLNMARRHLTSEQRSALGVEVKRWQAQLAKDRQGTRTDIEDDIPELIPECSRGDARDKAGEMVGINGKYIDEAEKLMEQAPDVFDRMKGGAYGSMAQAKQAARLTPEVRAEVHQEMETGKTFKEAKSFVMGEPEGDINNTPSEWVEFAREVMGGIDLDPATNADAQEIIRAATYYTRESDGLAQDWSGRVWVNPPYSSGLISRFVEKILSEWERGEITQMMVLTNASVCATWWHQLVRKADAVCFPKSRMNFWRGHAEQGNSNNYDQSVFFFGADATQFVDGALKDGHMPLAKAYGVST